MVHLKNIQDKSQQSRNLQNSKQSDLQNSNAKHQNDQKFKKNNDRSLKIEQCLKEIEELEKQIKEKCILYQNLQPLAIPLNSNPYEFTFKPKAKIVTVYQNLDEYQKDRIQSQQFSILKKIQETLNGGTRSFIRPITYQDGYSYEGDYQESNNEIILEGIGVLKYHDEIIYEGQFKNNKFHGIGILKQDNKLYNLLDWRRKDQSEIKGIFDNGILIGESLLVN